MWESGVAQNGVSWPSQSLTGERVDDWLTVLGYPLSPTLS